MFFEKRTEPSAIRCSSQPRSSMRCASSAWQAMITASNVSGSLLRSMHLHLAAAERAGRSGCCADGRSERCEVREQLVDIAPAAALHRPPDRAHRVHQAVVVEELQEADAPDNPASAFPASTRSPRSSAADRRRGTAVNSHACRASRQASCPARCPSPVRRARRLLKSMISPIMPAELAVQRVALPGEQPQRIGRPFIAVRIGDGERHVGPHRRHVEMLQQRREVRIVRPVEADEADVHRHRRARDGRCRPSRHGRQSARRCRRRRRPTFSRSAHAAPRPATPPPITAMRLRREIMRQFPDWRLCRFRAPACGRSHGR